MASAPTQPNSHRSHLRGGGGWRGGGVASQADSERYKENKSRVSKPPRLVEWIRDFFWLTDVITRKETGCRNLYVLPTMLARPLLCRRSKPAECFFAQARSKEII